MSTSLADSWKSRSLVSHSRIWSEEEHSIAQLCRTAVMSQILSFQSCKTFVPMENKKENFPSYSYCRRCCEQKGGLERRLCSSSSLWKKLERKVRECGASQTFVMGREFIAFWGTYLLFICGLTEAVWPALVDIYQSIKCSAKPLLNLHGLCAHNSLHVSCSEINSYMQ